VSDFVDSKPVQSSMGLWSDVERKAEMLTFGFKKTASDANSPRTQLNGNARTSARQVAAARTLSTPDDISIKRLSWFGRTGQSGLPTYNFTIAIYTYDPTGYGGSGQPLTKVGEAAGVFDNGTTQPNETEWFINVDISLPANNPGEEYILASVFDIDTLVGDSRDGTTSSVNNSDIYPDGLVDDWSILLQSASSSDPAIWADYEIITAPPTLTAPYSNLINIFGDAVSVDLSGHITDATSIDYSVFPATLSESSDLVTGTVTLPTGRTRVSVTATNSFGSIVETFEWDTLTIGAASNINTDINT